MLIRVYNVQKHHKFRNFLIRQLLLILMHLHVICGFIRYGALTIVNEDGTYVNYNVILEEVNR